MRPVANFFKMAKENVLEGVFAINKPVGMSSAQLIRDCQIQFNPSTVFRPLMEQELEARTREPKAQWRRRSKAKRDARIKMGHGGTLDPLASGVLILGVGRGTKELPQFLQCTKTYETVVLFGASTDTYDRLGRILTRRSYGDITRAKVEQALDSFRGRYKQMPPLYSALKMNGKPLYEYAREGKAIPREIETRDVEVTELEMVEWYEPGEHPHRWPAEEAGRAEQDLAERVWRKEKHQAVSKKLSPEEEKSDIEALEAHEAFKRKAEEKQDELVYDKPTKRRRTDSQVPMMSGALGALPGSGSGSSCRDGDGRPVGGKGSNLVPPPPAPNTPPPWEGKGPPAAKIRMTVTSGFYVRSFCHDLGEKIGSAAMMAELERTRQGDFRVGTANCLEYDDINKGEKVWGPQVERLLRQWMNKDAIRDAEAKPEAEPKKPPTPRSSPPRSRSHTPERKAPSSRQGTLKPASKPKEEVPVPASSPAAAAAVAADCNTSSTTIGDTSSEGKALPSDAKSEPAGGEPEPAGDEVQAAAESQSDPVLPTPKDEEAASVIADDKSWNGFTDDPVVPASSSAKEAVTA